MKYFFWGSFLLFLNISCTNKHETEKIIVLDANVKTAESMVQQVNIDMLRPARLYCVSDRIIVFDDVADSIFKVFNLPDLDLAYTYGRIGGGPGEFQMIDKECINTYEHKIEIIHRNEIMNFLVGDSSFNFVKPDDVSKSLLLTEASPLNNVKKVSEHSYVYNNNNLSGDFELYLYDINDIDKVPIGQLTEAEKQMPEQNKMAYFAKSICSDIQASKFATFYYMRPTFKIYDKSGQLLKTVTLNHRGTTSEDPATMYFTDAFATDKHIYAMWLGKSKNEVGRDLDAFRPEIMIFDWDGNLEKRIKLDKPIISCTVSEDSNELFGVSFLEDDCNKIIRYKL